MTYAEVAITSARQGGVHQTYHYTIPEALADLQIGDLVEVAFGTAHTAGIVVALSDSSPVPRTKPILDRLDPEPVVTPLQIELARWLSERTLASLGACLALTLPVGVTQSGDKRYSLQMLNPDPVLFVDDKATASRVIAMLQERGPLRSGQLNHAFRGVDWRQAIAPLIDQGVILRESLLNPPAVSAKHTRVVNLAIAPDQVESIISAFRRGSARARILRFLRDHPEQTPIESATLLKQAEADSGALKRLADGGLVTIDQAETWRDPLAGREFVTAEPPSLTPDQAAAWEMIRPAIENREARVFLLHGVTGSGKTELYLRAIAEAIGQGRQAIALVPEIALVAQTTRRFMARFQERVALAHSGLSAGEQFDTWRRARKNGFDVVIGARSALFTPLPNVGVIVLDEEHDSSYKQSPPLPPPYYHARDVAIQMGKLFGAPVILGSATPDLVTRWQAEQGAITYIHLPDRILAHRTQIAVQSEQLQNTTQASAQFVSADAPDALYAPLPPVTIVDMRAELRSGNRSIFSRDLHRALTDTLARGEQALLYLNRRGSATIVVCRDCGYIARCPRCDTPLTYHDSETRLICHSCNFRAMPPHVCPECASERIRYFGLGTARLEDEVKETFPDAQIARWDRDTVRKHGQHDEILERFISRQANVLIGTQMIAKGLDLPLVTLVGVVLADTTLGLPDYRAGERAFQLLTQVAGRAGRSWRGGQAILQTYQPTHYAVQAAAGHDYIGFYRRELAYRRELGYPPFTKLARLLFRSKSAEKVQRAAERAAEQVRAILETLPIEARLVGPAPAFFGKVMDVYRWQLLIKSSDPAAILRGFEPPADTFVDLDPVDIL